MGGSVPCWRCIAGWPVPIEVSDLPLFLVKLIRKGPFHNALKRAYVSREQSSQYFAYDKTKSIIPAHN